MISSAKREAVQQEFRAHPDTEEHQMETLKYE